jgi:hypothetical protein
MKKASIIRLIRLIGFLMAAVAFALPAVKGPGGSGPYSGWLCAVTAASATGGMIKEGGLSPGSDSVGSLCLVLSGWVNPLVVIYLLFLISPRWVVARRVVAGAIVVCLIATWNFLAIAPMVPLVGHFMWVGGIFLILGPEFVALFERRSAVTRG